MTASEPFQCFVEIPKGSRNKYEWDPEAGAIKLDRFLFSSVAYPGDYGFIPKTIARDGEPLDTLVCVSDATFPGCLIDVKVIALFRMFDEGAPDEKVICVPSHDPNWLDVDSLDDLPGQMRAEIQHFFSVYKEPEGKHVEVEGWCAREDALEAIEDARTRWVEAHERREEG
jgi:inorganic pyrophosphatase